MSKAHVLKISLRVVGYAGLVIAVGSGLLFLLESALYIMVLDNETMSNYMNSDPWFFWGPPFVVGLSVWLLLTRPARSRAIDFWKGVLFVAAGAATITGFVSLVLLFISHHLPLLFAHTGDVQTLDDWMYGGHSWRLILLAAGFGIGLLISINMEQPRKAQEPINGSEPSDQENPQ